LGKFSYFRHSVFTRNDDKIREFSRLLGRKSKEAYFYFFTLIEHCAAESSDGQTEFKVHHDTLRALWETNTRGVQTVCKLLTSSALLVCKQCANHVILDIPKLPFYLGMYEQKKRKEKENKGNKNKESEVAQSNDAKIIETNLFENSAVADFAERSYPSECQTILTLLNAICFTNYRPTKEIYLLISGLLKSGRTIADFEKVIKFKQHEWGDHPVFATNLRPQTIFGSKFNTYLEQANHWALKRKSGGGKVTPQNPTGNPYLNDDGSVKEGA
jgi:uncharacterized phage protein (TIGR02220 family)